MKDFATRIVSNAKSAVETGAYVFFLMVSVGIGWKLGTKVMEKVDKIDKKEK